MWWYIIIPNGGKCLCIYNHIAAGAQLSGGAIAGIVIPLFLVLLIASAGMTTGLLLWKYQPWDNCSVKASGTDGE